ncbi:uncharacterized protein CYBJADRAFT_167478 [Cyberlindnera jadinii NRRL Y-1542]|uniref:Uncharacterized protein n=1 Tax=Cyberlindnera jadinii (strain ATCC 18201 / CBS 1600 / BCRC 20928 / JCM 3617 / NBRC 0987 / NRRL Y-1542) TaxID=983966 RepID=A0A1E4RTN8_CYBJN|nr:hypothetical protein CYBJADRAFT_170094 [Cyberlindnera jadinii NRRL Y-1542]XP_020071135.1 hypothetical protein CYBJADRAFT_167478 [Cyberlindnera jadinii NRRL Y-1542]ODV70637.1 hypothetical protein CYBJADRAFT_170094 [Cyberlindnera jadinii NRRL Y-1542]ODV74096.1 hypothetical protein CYBJADRAFT_167478 [Cyberlindnera jadinii NRRL Y-1542]
MLSMKWVNYTSAKSASSHRYEPDRVETKLQTTLVICKQTYLLSWSCRCRLSSLSTNAMLIWSMVYTITSRRSIVYITSLVQLRYLKKSTNSRY